MTIFMERLQALMNEHNLSDKELRERCGSISKNNITNWRNGTKPQPATVDKLAQFFGVSTDYLLGIDDVKQKILDTLDTPIDLQNPQIQSLLKHFSQCDGDGQLRIIHVAMTEWERTMAEKKKGAERSVAELKTS